MKQPLTQKTPRGCAVAGLPDRWTPFRRALVQRVAETAGCGLVLLVLVALPWWFGGVTPRGQMWACLALLAALACWGVTALTAESPRIDVPRAAVPLVLAILFGLLQTLPLPNPLVACLSPSAARQWEPVLADAFPGESRRAWSTLSLYPASTRCDAGMLALSAAAFFLGMRFFSRQSAQMRLCAAIAANGAVLAVFSIVQQMTWNGKLFWWIEPTQVSSPFGPYVNHNHAAGYLNMCLAGAAAWVAFWGMRGQSDSGNLHSRVPSEISRPRSGRSSNPLRRLFRRFLRPGRAPREPRPVRCRCGVSPTGAAAYLAAAAILAGIVCSLSRGAYVATVSAAGLLIGLRFTGRPSFPLLGRSVMVLLAALGAVAALGLSPAVRDRVLSIANQWHSNERLIHWREALQAVPDYWLFGSGLGTYRFVYPQYETRTAQEWFFHAENQYVEALVEGGMIGICLLAAMIMGTAACASLVARSDPSRTARIFALAALFSLATQCVQALFDFGLYLPANMLLCAVMAGSIAGRAAITCGRSFPRSARRPFLPRSESQLRSTWTRGCVRRWTLRTRPAVLLLVATLCVQCVLPLYESSSLAAVHAARDRWLALPAGVSLPAAENVLAEFERAARRRWDDLDTHQALAQFREELYRRRLFAVMHSQQPQVPAKTLWERTDPSRLAALARRWRAAGDLATWQRIRDEAARQTDLRAAYEHGRLARRACPLVARQHVHVAEWSVLFAGPETEALYLASLEAMGRIGAGIAFYAGRLHFEAGRTESAFRLWRKCLAESDDFAEPIVTRCLERADLPTVIAAVLSDSPGVLLELARSRFPRNSHGDGHRLLLEAAARALASAGDADPRIWRDRGRWHALCDRWRDSAAAYRRALELRPGETGWRSEYAEALHRLGRDRQALAELGACLAHQPSDVRCRELAETIRRRAAENSRRGNTAPRPDPRADSDDFGSDAVVPAMQ